MLEVAVNSEGAYCPVKNFELLVCELKYLAKKVLKEIKVRGQDRWDIRTSPQRLTALTTVTIIEEEREQ